MRYHDYIVVGAGPAGLQMGYYLKKANRDHVILEANDAAGSFFATQPRHRKLLSINKRFNYFPEAEFNMRHDWNSLLTDDYSLLFRDYSEELFPHADDLYRYMRDFAEKYALDIQYNTRITSIERSQDGRANFLLTDTLGEQYSCSQLLMATGPVAPHIPVDIEGVELAEGYEDHDIDPARFENKRVMIIGRGNSAFEVADHLAGHAAMIHVLTGNRPVKLAWQTHFVGDLRAVNNNVLDMHQLKSLHGALPFLVKKLARQADGRFKVSYEADMAHWKTPGTIKGSLIYDEVIRCTGWNYVDQSIFAPDIRPAIDFKSKYPVLTSGWESSVPNLFFLGTVMSARDRKAASGFIHGFRYNVRTLFHMLEERYENIPLPADEFPLQHTDDLQMLADHLLKRMSTSSALYQLNGFMGDVLLFDSGQVKLVYEVPLDYALEQSAFTEGVDIAIMTLEYGFHHYPAEANTINFSAPDDSTDRNCAAFLHPVMRHYRNGKLVNEAHLFESFVVRLDSDNSSAAAYGEEFLNNVPKNITMNFLNQVSGITTEHFPEDLAVYSDDEEFIPWTDDKSVEAYPHPQCFASARSPEAPQVSA